MSGISRLEKEIAVRKMPPVSDEVKRRAQAEFDEKFKEANIVYQRSRNRLVVEFERLKNQLMVEFERGDNQAKDVHREVMRLALLEYKRKTGEDKPL